MVLAIPAVYYNSQMVYQTGIGFVVFRTGGTDGGQRFVH